MIEIVTAFVSAHWCMLGGAYTFIHLCIFNKW